MIHLLKMNQDNCFLSSLAFYRPKEFPTNSNRFLNNNYHQAHCHWPLWCLGDVSLNHNILILILLLQTLLKGLSMNFLKSATFWIWNVPLHMCYPSWSQGRHCQGPASAWRGILREAGFESSETNHSESSHWSKLVACVLLSGLLSLCSAQDGSLLLF